jgi:hypothetical protein
MVILNSSTSSSETVARQVAWRRYVRVAMGTIIGVLALCYGFLLLVDPYDNLPFSPDFDRKQVISSQRFFYPALARNPRFDSAIIGNSSVRLLRPEQLNGSLGGNFVNLAMNAASSWEQRQIFNVFQRSHETIENVLIGIGVHNWCGEVGTHEKFIGMYTAKDFPEWMYDEKTSNNLPRLDTTSLHHAWKQLLYMTGMRGGRFGDDGYTVFTNPQSEYDIKKARFKIYSSTSPKERKPQLPPVEMSSTERSEIPLPALVWLWQMLDTLPSSTRKIIVFAPQHVYYQSTPGSRQEIVWAECKQRIAEVASTRSNAFVIDFMFPSEITTTDSNYWDPMHYNIHVAEKLGNLIGEAVIQRTGSSNHKLLYAPLPD